jgi:hypothetical protein
MMGMLSRFLHRLPHIAAVVLLGSMVVGCPEKKKNQVVTGKPALELKKCISFPLMASDMPDTKQELLEEITNGLRGRVDIPRGTWPVTAMGRFPKFDNFTVDLTDAGIDSGRKLPKLKPRGPIEPGVRATKFRFMAEPMRVDGAKINLDVQARDVVLGLQRDKGRPILVFSEARDGTVTCETTNKDLSQIFKASANFRGKDFGLSVQKAKLLLTSENAHQISADLKLNCSLLIVPMALHFTARVDVNSAGIAHLSNLTCDGDDVGGSLIVNFIRPALKDYNNQTIPLIAFPTDKIRLHDVRVNIDGDDVRIAAAFGN